MKIAPAKTGAFRYVRAEFDGAREAGALKFLFDDRYLFITASDKWIIVCLSLFDLFGDDPDPEQGYDDSILRWTRKEDEKGQGEDC